MAKKSELQEVGEELAGEIERDAEVLGPELFGNLPDAEAMDKPAFLAHVRQHWADVNYRTALRARHGDKGFVSIYREMRKGEGEGDGR